MQDNRDILRWATGVKTNSWLDLYEGQVLKYSFFGRFINAQQYKLDARVVGIILTFEAMHPWAWSAPKTYNCYIGETMLSIDENGAIYKGSSTDSHLNLDKNGVLYNDTSNADMTFGITEHGVLNNPDKIDLTLNNQTDDLYNYIDLNIIYANDTGKEVRIINETLQEETRIDNIKDKETIEISAGQFIISDIPNKIFGNDFNFVYPRLAPGQNHIIVDASTGKGFFTFTYRYPIKIGDCAIDTVGLYDLYC